MREYRGLRTDGKGWVYGSRIDVNNRVFIAPYDNCYPASSCFSFHEVDPKTVGQATGLKDKNGTKIFEGDVVTALTVRSSILEESYDEYIIMFDNGAFNFSTRGGVVVRQWSDGSNDWTSIENVERCEIEVTGTIHSEVE